MQPFLVKTSLVHTWSNALSWTTVPKDLLIQQIPTLEVGWSRLETHSWSLTLAVTLALGRALGSVREQLPVYLRLQHAGWLARTYVRPAGARTGKVSAF